MHNCSRTCRNQSYMCVARIYGDRMRLRCPKPLLYLRGEGRVSFGGRCGCVRGRPYRSFAGASGEALVLWPGSRRFPSSARRHVELGEREILPSAFAVEWLGEAVGGPGGEVVRFVPREPPRGPQSPRLSRRTRHAAWGWVIPADYLRRTGCAWPVTVKRWCVEMTFF